MKKGVAQITDSIVAVGIFLLVMTLFIVPFGNWLLDQTRATVAATHAKKVQSAANQFIKDNHDVIAASATASTPYIFDVPHLIATGYLPAGFSPQNGYSSTYQTRVFEPAPNQLNAMTYLIGGVDISKSLARKIAIGIGADGGIVDGNVAQGALGSWTVALSSFGGFNPGDGHVVIAGFYNNGVNVSDYLYRKAVAGHPELNTMSTSLNMGGNNITNAATTTTTALNASTVQAGNITAASTVSDYVGAINIKATNIESTNVNADTVTAVNSNSQTSRALGESYAGGWFRTMGDGGWYSEKWGGGLYMDDSTWIKAVNNKSIYTGGQVQAGTVQSNGRITAKEFVQLDMIATVGTACPSNGLLGRDTLGAIVSCQSGVWNKSGAGELQRMAWTIGSGNNYGDACQNSLVSSGMSKQGWVATGSDACTEDNQTCTVDNVMCFAIKLK